MASTKKIYRVRALENKLCPHPGSIGTGTIHMIGQEKYQDEKDLRWPDGKNAVPSTKYRLAKDPTELVVDTTDGFLEAKFMDGCLEYVETVDGFNVEAGKGTVDEKLVARIAAAKAVREPPRKAEPADEPEAESAFESDAHPADSLTS